MALHVTRIPISRHSNVYKRFFLTHEVVPLDNDDRRWRRKVVTDVVATFSKDNLSLPAREMRCLLFAGMFASRFHFFFYWLWTKNVQIQNWTNNRNQLGFGLADCFFENFLGRILCSNLKKRREKSGCSCDSLTGGVMHRLRLRNCIHSGWAWLEKVTNLHIYRIMQRGGRRARPITTGKSDICMVLIKN